MLFIYIYNITHTVIWRGFGLNSSSVLSDRSMALQIWLGHKSVRRAWSYICPDRAQSNEHKDLTALNSMFASALSKRSLCTRFVTTLIAAKLIVPRYGYTRH